MYNSRQRRTNYEGYPQDFMVPENYSGNAFREGVGEAPYEIDEVSFFEEAKEPIEEEKQQQIDLPVGKADEDEHKNSQTPCRTGFGFNLGKLFGSIGFEELLIIGLILLIAQKENNEDIIVLLALLLFVG